MTSEAPSLPEVEADSSRKVRDKIDDAGPTLAMIMIIALVILVVVFVLMPRDPATIVVQSEGTAADFSATSALAYADRVSRIAELAVATVLTLAIGLVGFSWVSNNARIERDRQELAEHKSNLSVQLDDRLENVAVELDSMRREIEIRELSKAAAREVADGQARNPSVEEEMIWALLGAGRNTDAVSAYTDWVESIASAMTTNDIHPTAWRSEASWWTIKAGGPGRLSDRLLVRINTECRTLPSYHFLSLQPRHSQALGVILPPMSDASRRIGVEKGTQMGRLMSSLNSIETSMSEGMKTAIAEGTLITDRQDN